MRQNLFCAPATSAASAANSAWGCTSRGGKWRGLRLVRKHCLPIRIGGDPFQATAIGSQSQPVWAPLFAHVEDAHHFCRKFRTPREHSKLGVDRKSVV